MERTPILVIQCQWCAATYAAHVLDDGADDALIGRTVKAAARRGDLVTVRRSGIRAELQPCRCPDGKGG